MPRSRRFWIRLTFVVAALSGSVGALATALPTAVITLSRHAGPPTTSITVAGAGFAAGEGIVLRFDGARVGHATADPAGSFAGAVDAVPADALPGTHEFEAAGVTSKVVGRVGFLVRTNWSQFRRGPRH